MTNARLAKVATKKGHVRDVDLIERPYQSSAA